MARWMMISILLSTLMLMISGPIYLPLVIGSSALPTPTDTATPTATPTVTATATVTPTTTATPTPTASPPAPPGENVDCRTLGIVQVCAAISNNTPQRYTNVTAYGRLYAAGAPVVGAAVHTTWHFRTTTPTEDCETETDGIGHCTRNIGGASTGYRVNVDVRITYQGNNYTARTWFTPQ